MSMPIDIEIICAVCGKKSTQTALASTNRFGPPDLDLRPPEMERSTMEWWIQECPYCGYVAKDISNETSITKEWLKNREYFSCENQPFKSNLAQKFYKQYMIAIKDEKNEAAFHSAIYAAWACDDVQDADNAIFCRKKALELFEKLIIEQEEKEIFLLIRADLLRRTRQFDLLIVEYKEEDFSEEELRKIVAFQIKKAKQQDTACYTMADVL